MPPGLSGQEELLCLAAESQPSHLRTLEERWTSQQSQDSAQVSEQHEALG